MPARSGHKGYWRHLAFVPNFRFIYQNNQGEYLLAWHKVQLRKSRKKAYAFFVFAMRERLHSQMSRMSRSDLLCLGVRPLSNTITKINEKNISWSENTSWLRGNPKKMDVIVLDWNSDILIRAEGRSNLYFTHEHEKCVHDASFETMSSTTLSYQRYILC